MLQNLLLAQTADDPVDPNFENVTLLLSGDGTNGGQNNTFVDGSTNNFTITRNGNPTQGTFSPYGDRWSNYFDGGSTTELLAGTGTSTAFDFGTGDFTIECWAYVTSQINGFTILGATTGANQYWGFGSLGSGGMTMYAGTAGTDIYSGSGSTPALNQWNHLVWQRASGVASMYLNGTRVYNASYTANFGTSATGFSVGKSASYANYYTTGYISNFRVVSGSAVYSGATISVPTFPLTAISGTSLLTCQSNRFIDNSSNNFSITVNGSPSVQRFNPFAPSAAYSASLSGGSGYFDGTGDFLNTSSNTWTQLSTGNFTVEAWCYIVSYGTYAAIFDARSTSSFTPWILGINSSGYVDFFYGTVSTARLTDNVAVGLNRWVHVAVVRNGSTISLYVDGVSKATVNYSSSMNGASTAPSIGRLVDPVNINGYISSARVVIGTAVYTSNFTPPSAPLTAITNTSLLLNFTNASIIDNAMLADLETVGNAQISTSVKKYGTGSLAFDGTGDYLIAPSNPNLALGAGDFTIEFWAYLSGTSSAQILFDQRTAATQVVPSIFVELNTIYYFVNGASRISALFTTTNTWVHIAVSRSGTSTKMFVGGTQAGSTYTDSNNYIQNPIYIGARWDATASVNGYIDDLRITKGVARYTANFTPPAQSLPTK